MRTKSKATRARQRAYDRSPARRKAHELRERERRAKLRETVEVIDDAPLN